MKELTPSSRNKLLREPETKTIYVNENHLKPSLKQRFMQGMIDPYNISFYSLHSNARSFYFLWRGQGYKAVFTYQEKNVLLIYNK